MHTLHYFIWGFILVSTYQRSIIINKKVVEYTDDDFPKYMGTHNLSLVLFYSPWCPHCKKVQPIFEEAARKLTNCNPPVTLVKINCRDNSKTCTGYKIKKYPTFKLLMQGFEVQDYNGPRDMKSMVDYVKSYTVDCAESDFIRDFDEHIKNADDEDLGQLLEKLLALADRDQTEF